MKSKLRKITIDNQVYLWNSTHKYNCTDDSYTSRLFFSPEKNKQLYVECYFKSHAHFYMGCHLNVGFLAEKDGKEVEISFNHPGFVAELIKFILSNKADFSKKDKYRFENVWDFLSEMGYGSFKTPYGFIPSSKL